MWLIVGGVVHCRQVLICGSQLTLTGFRGKTEGEVTQD